MRFVQPFCGPAWIQACRLLREKPDQDQVYLHVLIRNASPPRQVSNQNNRMSCPATLAMTGQLHLRSSHTPTAELVIPKGKAK